jgi:hypothetical protein
MSARIEAQGVAIRALGVQKLFAVPVVVARGAYGFRQTGSAS